jgi:hypothetical protein
MNLELELDVGQSDYLVAEKQKITCTVEIELAAQPSLVLLSTVLNVILHYIYI